MIGLIIPTIACLLIYSLLIYSSLLEGASILDPELWEKTHEKYSKKLQHCPPTNKSCSRNEKEESLSDLLDLLSIDSRNQKIMDQILERLEKGERVPGGQNTYLQSIVASDEKDDYKIRQKRRKISLLLDFCEIYNNKEGE